MKTPEGINVPMRIALQKILKANDDRQYQLQVQEAQLEDAMRNMQVPDGFAQMLGAYVQAIKSMAFPGGAGQARDPESYRAEMVEYAAYRWAGVFIERTPSGGFVMHDFEEYFGRALRITFEPGTKQACITTEDNEFSLYGETVHAFLRYLHFIGMFTAIDARIPCPQCEPREGEPEINKGCTNCDGLGWTVDNPANKTHLVVER